MNLFSHLFISIRLKNIIEKNLNVRLNTLSFMFGSIKPDISFHFINIPHYKKDSDAFIQKEIQSMLEGRVYEFNKCSGNFSERLGILVHYLSDFFCFAHSEHFSKSMFIHNVYEMHLFIYHTLNSKVLAESCNEKDMVFNYNISSIYSHINELHKKYLEACIEAHPLLDISFTLEACTSLCLSIISACMVNKENFSDTAGEVLL